MTPEKLKEIKETIDSSLKDLSKVDILKKSIILGTDIMHEYTFMRLTLDEVAEAQKHLCKYTKENT